MAASPSESEQSDFSYASQPTTIVSCRACSFFWRFVCADQLTDFSRARSGAAPRDVIYTVGVTDLTKANATNTCLSLRSDTVYCVVRSPQAANYAMDKALRVLDAIAKRGAQ